MSDLITDISKTLQAIVASSATNIILWLLSLIGGVALMLWVTTPDDPAISMARAQVLNEIWPLIAAWYTAITLKSGITATQKREALRSASYLQGERIKADTARTVVTGERTTPPMNSTGGSGSL